MEVLEVEVVPRQA